MNLWLARGLRPVHCGIGRDVTASRSRSLAHKVKEVTGKVINLIYSVTYGRIHLFYDCVFTQMFLNI